MVALQASIGTLNDLLDAERDVGRTPPKPIPAGRVAPGTARLLWIGSAVIGLLLLVPSGGLTLVVAIVGLLVGYAYDGFAKGTEWSWLPFAVGIPLVPVYGWVGTGTPLPAPFAILVPCAVLAGAALAIANASADLERDAASGIASVAVRLGLPRAWLVHVALLGTASVVMSASLVAADPGPVPLIATALGVAIVVTGAVIGATAGGHTATSSQRERAWETEAVGVGILATAWLVGMAGAVGRL
jgi:4-hydroxybenzoate polyprenyltransferase and related prenyltransferases